MDTKTLLEETNQTMNCLINLELNAHPPVSSIFFTPVANSQIFCVASTSTLVLQMVSAKSHFYFCSTRRQPYH
jgi:hypothetical protein